MSVPKFLCQNSMRLNCIDSALHPSDFKIKTKLFAYEFSSQLVSMGTLWTPTWWVVLYTIRVGTTINCAADGYVMQSVHFPVKIDCFVRNAANGNLYAKTGGRIWVINSSLQVLTTVPEKNARSAVIGIILYWTLGNKEFVVPESFTINSQMFGYECLESVNTSVRAAFDRMQSTLPPNNSTAVLLNCPHNAWKEIIYTFVTKATTFYLIRNQVNEAQIWYKNSTELCDRQFIRTVNCVSKSYDRNKPIPFYEPKSVLYTASGNPSSLFILFTNHADLSVVCEYQWGSDSTNINESWKQSAASRILHTAARKLYKTGFEGMEVLLVLAQNQILMLCLPLTNNPIPPEEILDYGFGFQDDTFLTVKDSPLIVDLKPNGNFSQVYVSTDSMIALVSLDKCVRFKNRIECLGSHPSQCGWCPSTNRCSSRRFCTIGNNNIVSKNAWINSDDTGDDQGGFLSTRTQRQEPREQLEVYVRSTPAAIGSLLPASTLSFLSGEKQQGTLLMDMVLWVAVGVVIILLILTIVYLVRYIEIRKANRKLVQRLRDRYPQCRGMKSYSRIRDTLKEEVSIKGSWNTKTVYSRVC
ncbi:uncharacterized protein LOC129582251 isoform X2 [Paramacrobiotus metropolitanus]|uniref:uncharacterized protein LOC129582251 isoform X2 n=1 Tax=Paramacrobiotus metropolitanus TaxID=2943436 RepID=UPI0024461C3E|nr:uncharacterized protein LOC129582251 isoform X2 [Paramacrobiotus metropolitanus]